MDEDRSRIGKLLQLEHPNIYKQFERDAFVEIEILKQSVEH